MECERAALCMGAVIIINLQQNAVSIQQSRKCTCVNLSMTLAIVHWQWEDNHGDRNYVLQIKLPTQKMYGFLKRSSVTFTPHGVKWCTELPSIVLGIRALNMFNVIFAPKIRRCISKFWKLVFFLFLSLFSLIPMPCRTSTVEVAIAARKTINGIDRKF